MTDQRNFRSSYLEKVGIKGVEEKKSLEILLKDQPLDVNKLLQFSLRFPVPAAYRTYLWKVLLGILPPYQETHEFVMRQKSCQYYDLLEALEAMGKVSAETATAEVNLQMMLVQEGTLPFDQKRMLHDPDNQSFLAICNAMAEVAEDPIDLYCLSTYFYKFQEKFKDELHILVERVEYYLKKEDTDGHLYKHLNHLRVFGLLPLMQWFKCCYAGILPANSFERIWDKIVGGSCKIMVYVAVAILLTFRRPIMTMKNYEDIINYLSNIPGDSGDHIVAKALEIWEKHGSLLMPPLNRGDSPGTTDKGHG